MGRGDSREGAGGRDAEEPGRSAQLSRTVEVPEGGMGATLPAWSAGPMRLQHQAQERRDVGAGRAADPVLGCEVWQTMKGVPV